MTKIMYNIGQYIKNNSYLVFLLILAFGLRVGYPLGGHFAFIFDHGKDALNTLEMMITHSPKLIGPWTSIPGFYFGPTWYYFLAVCLLLGRLAPAAPVWGMICLALGQVYLVYRYFGRIPATSVAAGTAWLITTTSAWNPFPLTLISWGLLALLHQTATDHRLTFKRAVMAGFLAAWGWHFSSAYAIFYPLIILLCWIYQRLIINWKVILGAALGFIIPFVPQVVFELRHDWVEVRALAAYVADREERAVDGWSLAKVGQVLTTAEQEWEINAFPDIVWPGASSSWSVRRLAAVVWGLALLVFCWQVLRKKYDLPPLFVESLIFIFVPLLGFCGLHFNVWYLLGMAPAALLLVAGVVATWPKMAQNCWLTLVLLGGATIGLREFVWEDVNLKDTYYHQWAQVWAEVQRLSYGHNYQLYTYRADIYDFNLQYLVIRSALVDQVPLPVEFAYQPGESAYLPFKPALTANLTVQQGRPDYVFYVLDQPNPNSPTFQAWQARNPDFARAEWVKTIGENIQIWRADYHFPVRILGAGEARESSAAADLDWTELTGEAEETILSY